MTAQKRQMAGQVFRQHPMVRLVLPGLPWFAAIAGICAAGFILLSRFQLVPWLFILLLVPIGKLLLLYLDWWAYTVSINTHTRSIVQRSGVFTVFRREIPLTRLVSVSCKRPWWAILTGLDVGDIQLEGAIGEPLLLTSMGGLSRLWQVLEGKGRTGLAKSRPSSGQQRPETSHGAIPDGGYFYHGEPFTARIPSLAGILAFCEQFLLLEGDWSKPHYALLDRSRYYYPAGLVDEVAKVYLDVLRDVAVLINGPNGCQGERVSGRIRSVADIEPLIRNHVRPWRKAA